MHKVWLSGVLQVQFLLVLCCLQCRNQWCAHSLNQLISFKISIYVVMPDKGGDTCTIDWYECMKLVVMAKQLGRESCMSDVVR